MERKILALLCFIAMMTLLLASCGNIGNIGDTDNQGGAGEICEHTFSDKWSANSIQHWHAVTCEHTSLKADVDSHIDSDENGECDVCAYDVGHEHTFSDAWQSDASHHWRESTCSHLGEKTDLTVHTDSDFDASCDTCSAHVHVIDVFGKCTSCGEKVADVDISNLDAIIPIIVSNAGKIASGTLNYEFFSSTPSTPGLIRNEMTLAYVLGNNAAYYRSENRSNNYGNTASDTQESWYHLVDADSVFGVYRQVNGSAVSDFMLDAAASVSKLVGHYYSVSTLASAHGAENLLGELYSLAKTDNSTGFTSAYGNGIYTFAFNYLYVNSDTGMGEAPHTDYYKVKVSFNISDSGALTSLNVLCDCYSNSLENDLDNDFDYDKATNTVTMRDNARPDTYSFSVTQTEGARDYVSEHPRSEFIPDDFDVFTDPACTDKVTGTLSATVDKVFHLYLGNFAPAGTSISYVADSFAVFCPYSDAICFSNSITASIVINIKTEGTYTFTITAGDIVKEITVTAVKQTPPQVDPTPIPENTLAVQITDNNAWNKDFVTFVAPADADYTFIIPAGAYVGAWGDGEAEPFADYNVLDQLTKLPLGGTKTVSLKEGESYKFFVSAPEMNITVYISYEISDYTGNNGSENVPEEPVLEPITVGTHTVVVTDSDITSESISYILEVTEEGTYTFDGEGVFANFYSSNGLLVSRGTAYLTKDTYTVSVYVGGLTEPGEYTFTLSYSAPIGGGTEDPDPTPTPTPDPEPDADRTGLEGTFIAHTVYNSNVRVLVNSTSINIIDPEGRVLTFTYTYVDGVFEVYYKGNKLPNTTDPKFTITDGVLTEIVNNGNHYTLEPTDEEITLENNGTKPAPTEPDGTEQNPYVLDTLPESITFTSNTTSKVFYVFTAEKSGTFTITWPSADSWGNVFELDENGNNTGNDTSAYLTETITLEITEGYTYKFSLGTWNKSGKITVTLSID